MRLPTDAQLREGADPNRAAFDETVIQPDTERYWLDALVEAAISRLLRGRLFQREHGR